VVIISRSEVTQLRAGPGLTLLTTKGSHHQTKRAGTRAAIITGDETQDTCNEQSQTRSRRNDRRLAVRGELGLAGLTESAKRALTITEKKMEKREAIAKSAYRHAMKQQPTKVMYYKVYGTTKWLRKSSN
jgi:pre-60S factor REI1